MAELTLGIFLLWGTKMAAIVVTSTLATYPTVGPTTTGVLYKKMFIVQGTSANNGDTMTITGLTTIQGAYGICTTAGTLTQVGTGSLYSVATNVLTLNNGENAVWTFLVWGV